MRGALAHPNAHVRSRAALAAGRIGDEGSVPALINMLQEDADINGRAVAAFALGEIESGLGTSALLQALKETRHPLVKARVFEALGKIAALLPKEQEPQTREIGSAILNALKFEHQRRAAADRLTVLLGITAALRAKPSDAGSVIAEFLNYSDPRIRSDAANALARLRLKDGNAHLRKLIKSDPDANVRANAARVLGATEDKEAFDGLLDRAVNDSDSRVRVSAIRALATLKDERATGPMIARGSALVESARGAMNGAPGTQPKEANELLEIATTLGRLKQHSQDAKTLDWLKQARLVIGPSSPEVQIATVRISPAGYLSQSRNDALTKRKVQETILLNWRAASSLAQGLGEIATLPDSAKDKKQLQSQAEELLRAMLDYRNSGLTINTLVAVHSEYAVPDVLRAFAAFKPADLADVLRKHLNEPDVIVRGTAADLLGDLPLNITNIEALGAALPIALRDKDNDAALSILDALGKQKNRNANQAMMIALDSTDHLIRRRAVASLKAAGAGDFSTRIGTVKTKNTAADYERAVGRIGKRVTATVTTTKGEFTIELVPDHAPLTVDNFVQLAKRGYFRGIVVHRVVPNFVIQDGDPRGDGNGGPGYQIRCEINEVPYERGAVGMALSGKDTGGSQWFVTHAPQPHLDGGYTVFGTVVSGMAVVDEIVRGDVIKSITVREARR